MQIIKTSFLTFPTRERERFPRDHTRSFKVNYFVSIAVSETSVFSSFRAGKKSTFCFKKLIRVFSRDLNTYTTKSKYHATVKI